MQVKNKEFNRQADIIKGDEAYIIGILEKWKVSEHDIALIQDKIATIQERTVELFKTKQGHDEYIKKFGVGNKSLKSQGITHTNKPQIKRVYQVFRDGKLIMEDINARVSERFGMSAGALSKVKDKGIIKGYEIVAIERT